MTDVMAPSCATPEGPRFSGSVLVADDDTAVTRLLARLLSAHGYSVDVAASGEAALTRVVETRPDLAILDIRMPGLSGIEVCQRLRAASETRLLPVIVMTGLDCHELRLAGIAAGVNDFLTKPIDQFELLVRVQSLVQLKRYTDDLESAGTVMMTLAAMVEARDGYRDGHCHRMANYSAAIGQRLGLGDGDLQALRRGGFLHDIGMLAVPDTVLLKPGPLEPDEHELIMSHTVLGESLILQLRSLSHVAPIIRHHHERRDGSGYPDGLKGDAIPLLAQIIGVVDVFESITTGRSYRRPAPAEVAFNVLGDHIRRGWRRADLVDHLADAVRTRGVA